MQESCPGKCKCSLMSVTFHANVSKSVMVECRNQSLSQLPERLPPMTKKLDVSRNQVRFYKTQHNVVLSRNLLRFSADLVIEGDPEQ